MVKDVVISLDRSSRSRSPSPNPREYHERSDEETRRNDKTDKENQRNDRETRRNDTSNEESSDTSDERGRSRERISVGVGADPDMISIMGFGGFGSTKGKHVSGSKGGAVKKKEVTEYRQYMNRSKGFNRPLSPGK
ncbi:hypothetical protein JA9_000896 [Meyerozyma sp. JA9]|nr:hypothetical protein JA9_000896 [Meyerozyma sp. JA9]